MPSCGRTDIQQCLLREARRDFPLPGDRCPLSSGSIRARGWPSTPSSPTQLPESRLERDGSKSRGPTALCLLTSLSHGQRLALSLHVRDLASCLSVVRAGITNVLDLMMTVTMANTTAGSEPARAAPLPARARRGCRAAMGRLDEINRSAEVPAQGQRLRIPVPAAGHCGQEPREGGLDLRR